MTPLSRVFVTGCLTTTSPLHIAGFDEAAPGNATGHWQEGVTGRGAKVTAVQRLPVLAPAAAGLEDDPLIAETDGADAADAAADVPARAPWNERARVEIPVIQATTLRGGLRRAAANLVKEALIARGEVLSLGAYNALQTGAPNATGNNRDAVDVAATYAAQQHPFIGIFGGGAALYRSSLVVTTAVPPLDHPVVLGMLPAGAVATPLRARGADGRERALSPTELVKRLWFVRRDDALDLSDPLATQVVADFTEQIEGRALAVAAETERDLRTLAAIEVVVPGTPFFAQWELTAPTSAQLGLLLCSLQRFAQQNRLGGLTRHGFGRFSLALTLTDAQGASVPVFVVHDDTPYALNLASTVIAEAVTAWQQAAGDLTAAAFESLYLPQGEAPAKKRGRPATKQVPSP